MFDKRGMSVDMKGREVSIAEGILIRGNPQGACSQLQMNTQPENHGRHLFVTWTPGKDSGSGDCSLDLKLRNADIAGFSMVLIQVIGDDPSDYQMKHQHGGFQSIKVAALLGQRGTQLLRPYIYHSNNTTSINRAKVFVISGQIMGRAVGYEWYGLPLLTATSTLDAFVQIYVCLLVMVGIAVAIINWGLSVSWDKNKQSKQIHAHTQFEENSFLMIIR